MRGQHDIGGLPGGPIDTSDSDMEPWAKLITAISSALRSRGHVHLDELRRTMEGLPEDVYAQPYFERWAECLCVIIEEKGLVTGAEIQQRMT